MLKFRKKATHALLELSHLVESGEIDLGSTYFLGEVLRGLRLLVVIIYCGIYAGGTANASSIIANGDIYIVRQVWIAQIRATTPKRRRSIIVAYSIVCIIIPAACCWADSQHL
jgi:hypothetical protein